MMKLVRTSLNPAACLELLVSRAAPSRDRERTSASLGGKGSSISSQPASLLLPQQPYSSFPHHVHFRFPS